MTRFLLVRHGAYAMIGHGLGGRVAHALDETGSAQAERLAERLQRGGGIVAVVSSPVRRACETAEPLARRLGLTVQIEPDFAEIDLAGWTGASFASLKADPAWRAWNIFRSTAPVPDGEGMLAVQSRVVAGLRRLAAVHETGIVAVFSHGDVIKAALMHFLGAPLDLMRRLEIAPASVSEIELHAEGATILGVNRTD